MSYRTLDIYKLSFDLFIRTHPNSLKLPKYELYELGSQFEPLQKECNLLGGKINNYLKWVNINWNDEKNKS
ncbi:hypothetical protein [Chryseobacterium sp. MP_3.2]|uniref:hypothetical protein n=1 Tax=Chryseobacterium sp. MP_3.2 TaxID=3071712 RepID=UPI002DF75C59|nr:hypothetical protein [Chryseobacterium sp. MP_3.2]